MNSAVQVAGLNTAYSQPPKEKKDRKWEAYLNFFHSKNTRKKDRHKLGRKTRYWINFLQQENYLLTPLEEIFKGSLSGGRENPYIALDIENKNLFFYQVLGIECFRWLHCLESHPSFYFQSAFMLFFGGDFDLSLKSLVLIFPQFNQSFLHLENKNLQKFISNWISDNSIS